jgi:hypothetical protein
MDLNKMIAELQAERDRLTQAIEALERLNTGNSSRRGRPPAWLKKELESDNDSAREQPEAE